jgi:predicted HTH transcriptional regulator
MSIYTASWNSTDSDSISTVSRDSISSTTSEELWSNFHAYTVFPRLEGSTLEFKQSISMMHYKKIPETLCGFLNTDGGTMAFGIRDDGMITGLQSSPKEMDNFLLQIDRIFHEAEIRTTDLERVHPSCVKTSVLPSYSGKYVIVIHVSPTPGKQYQLKDGTVWYRLNASNYKITGSDQLFTESDLRIHVARARKNMTREFSAAISEIRTNSRTKDSTIRSLQNSLKRKDAESEAVTELLFAKILSEKQEAEKQIANQRMFFCGLL